MRLKHRYKSCLWCRADIWGGLLTKKHTFLRPKWDAMMGILNSQKGRRRVTFKKKRRVPFPMAIDFRFLKTRSRPNQSFKYTRWGFRNTLSLLFCLRRFYGDISHKSFKAFCKPLFKKKKPTTALFEALEGRLDICLYRLGFFHSIYYSRQAILHKKVLVNNKKIGDGGYVLSAGDLIEFCPEHRASIKLRLQARYKRFFTKKPTIAWWRLSIPNKFIFHLYPTPNWIQTEYSNLSFLIISRLYGPIIYPFRAEVDEALWTAKYGYL